VPNRDTPLITGINDETGLEMMHAVAKKALEEDPRPMNAMPLRLDGDDGLIGMCRTIIHYISLSLCSN